MKKHAIASLVASLLFVRFAMATTTQVNPLNYQSVISAAQTGDTISFQAGTYPPIDSYINLTSGVNYIGNGVTLTATPALIASGIPSIVCNGSATGTTTFTGFTLTGGAKFQNGSYNVTGNTFTGVGVTVNAIANSHFDNNAFNGINGVGIYGWPGNSNTYDNNGFTNTAEGLHLIAPCDHNDVSGNVVTGASDCGIELQDAMTNLTVENNWIGQWSVANGHMGISCATGNGKNITVTGNTILQSAPIVGQGYALEIAGSNVTVKNNTIWGWGTFILDALQQPNTFSNNKVYGGSEWGQDGGGPYPAPTDSDGPIQALSAYTPGKPPAITNASSPASPTTAPAQPGIPPGISAVLGPAPGTVVVVAPTGSTLSIYPSSQGPSGAVGLGTMNSTMATIGGIPQNWQITVTVATGGQTYTLPSVQVLQSAVPVTGPFNPQLVAGSAPAAEPAPSTLEFESVDGGKTITRTN